MGPAETSSQIAHRAKSRSIFEGVVSKEKELEVLHDDRSVSQFKDIQEIGDILDRLEFASPPEKGKISPLLVQWSKRFSNHLAWLSDPDDEFACHHSRYLRVFAEVLSLLNCLSPAYREMAVDSLEARIAASHDPESRFMSNIRERVADIKKLAVVDVELPIWPTPESAANAVRDLRKRQIVSSPQDILETIEAVRSR